MATKQQAGDDFAFALLVPLILRAALLGKSFWTGDKGEQRTAAPENFQYNTEIQKIVQMFVPAVGVGGSNSGEKKLLLAVLALPVLRSSASAPVVSGKKNQ